MFFDLETPVQAPEAPAQVQTSAPETPPSEERMKVFRERHDLFRRGLAWILKEYDRLGWNSGPRTFEPEFEHKLKRFDTDVAGAMDAAWAALTPAERVICDPFPRKSAA